MVPEGGAYDVQSAVLGEYLINRVIDMGFIIETDHLSARARDRALTILEQRDYSGVITSHSWGGDISRVRIQKLGGIVSPCANSTRRFIAEWKEARTTQSADFLWGIGCGTNANGLGAQAAPGPGVTNDNSVLNPFASFDGRTSTWSAGLIAGQIEVISVMDLGKSIPGL